MDLIIQPHECVSLCENECESSWALQNESRDLVRFRTDGRLEFDDRDSDQIVATFWRVWDMLGLPASPIRISGGYRAELRPATVFLHKSGDVTGENYTPDERALKLWGALAAAWPSK